MILVIEKQCQKDCERGRVWSLVWYTNQPFNLQATRLAAWCGAFGLKDLDEILDRAQSFDLVSYIDDARMP